MVKGGGKLSTVTMMLGILGGCRMSKNPPRAARCHEAAPCPWRHTERRCVPARGETWGKEGWDVPELSQALVHVLLHREARKE